MAAKIPIRMILIPLAAVAVVIAGVVAIVIAGVVAIVIAEAQSASFGWFAYAPLPGTVFNPDGAMVVSWGAIAGAAAVALGIAGLSFGAGFTIATSRSKTTH